MELNIEQLKIVKSMAFKDANEADLQYVKQVCKSRDLDPFAGHVVFSKRNSKGGSQIVVTTTIDGARAKAAKTGEYAGSDKPIHRDGEDGPSCEVTVYRMIKNTRCPFTAELLLNEFKPPSGQDHQWRRMPKHMLAKCAEMAALKKGFSDMLGGEYEESEHIPHEEEATTLPKVLDAPSNVVRWSKVKAAFAVHGIDEATLLADPRVADKVEDLTSEHFETLHKWFTECQNAAAN